MHVPDLYGGKTFGSIEEGFEFQKGVDGDALADAAVADLPAGLVYAGFSWGVPQAQRLAQTRGGAKGALLYESCIPITGEWAFGPWPDGVPVQIHGMDEDEFFAKEGDIDAAREIVAELGPDLAELYTYPGDAHLFADRTPAVVRRRGRRPRSSPSARWRSSTASPSWRCEMSCAPKPVRSWEEGCARPGRAVMPRSEPADQPGRALVLAGHTVKVERVGCRPRLDLIPSQRLPRTSVIVVRMVRW